MRTHPFTGFAALLALLGFFVASPARVVAAEEPFGEARVYKRVDGNELKLFIVKPENSTSKDKRPAVVFFHGGGWVGGTPSQFNQTSRYLATRGMVCISVDYRLLKGKPKETPPLVCVQDAKSAMRWVRAHAMELGIDPHRIAAGGSSAGGHLAAFVGLVEGLDDPQDNLKISPKADAMLLFNPVLDNGPDGGYGQGRIGDRYKEFSPAHNVTSNAPPAIVFLGTKDHLIPVSVMERFQANMQKAGNRCETRFYENQGHSFWGREPFRTRTLIETDKFLASLGWLKGAPTIRESEAPVQTKASGKKSK